MKENRTSKIRPTVISFGIFVALMLFQTSYLRLGTIAASVSAALIIISFFIDNKSLVIRVTKVGIAAAVFAVHIFLLALLKGYFPSDLLPLLTYLLLFVLLSGFRMKTEEHDFIKKIFVLASVFYSLLTIRSCVSLAGVRYTHGSIELFHTKIDPNFIAIPLVAALSLLFECIGNKKRRIWAIAGYIIVAGAILFTASRGAFLAVAVTFVCFLTFYLTSKRIGAREKLQMLLVFLGGVLLVSYLAITYFPQQLERMAAFEEGADNGRLGLWMESVGLWAEHPLLGAGLDGMHRIHGKASHNTYLQILSETGLIGFTCVLIMVVPLVKKCFRYDRSIFVLCCGMFFQIIFLSALSDRCVWAVLIWLVMLPGRQPQGETESGQPA